MQKKVISERQQKLNSELHSSNDKFGNRATGAGLAKNLPAVIRRMHELGICNSFLDYGTGKGLLVQHLIDNVKANVQITGYDPAIPQFAKHPTQPADILCCLDVLEHVELTSIDSVIQDIKDLTNHFCYIVIDLQPAVKTLSDGRNAHILLAPSDWWVNKFSQQFSSIAAFPVFHKCGLEQKLIIAGTNNMNMTSYMYSFLLKMNVFTMNLGGGVLSKVKL